MKNQTKWAIAVFLAVCFLVSVTAASVSTDQKKGLCINLEKATLKNDNFRKVLYTGCLLYTSPSPRDGLLSIRRQRQMCIRDRVTAASVSTDQKKGLCINLEKATLKNDNFRKVLYTGPVSYTHLTLPTNREV